MLQFSQPKMTPSAPLTEIAKIGAAESFPGILASPSRSRRSVFAFPKSSSLHTVLSVIHTSSTSSPCLNPVISCHHQFSFLSSIVSSHIGIGAMSDTGTSPGNMDKE